MNNRDLMGFNTSIIVILLTSIRITAIFKRTSS